MVGICKIKWNEEAGNAQRPQALRKRYLISLLFDVTFSK